MWPPTGAGGLHCSVGLSGTGDRGFASGLIAVPFLALLLPLQITVPAIVMLDYLASASHGVKHREDIQWRDLLPLLPFSVLGVLAALYLFKNIDNQILARILGTFIIVYAVYSLFNLSSGKGVSRAWALPAGGLGGFVGTLCFSW